MKKNIIHIKVTLKSDGTILTSAQRINRIVREKRDEKSAHVAFNARPVVVEFGELFVITVAKEARSLSFDDILKQSQRNLKTL